MLLVVACSKGARVATAWIKLKKDYLAEGLADTLDVIPIAAFNGASQRPSEKARAAFSHYLGVCLSAVIC
jgi:hypothetical protein